MTEILTESFCERCGTRYTFESARPRARLLGVRVLSRGLKNFVLSDDTSMDEAMAAARSDTDRELTAHQLDAFHKTFNFCMSCRQYTCPNCWNEVEARCLTCAPHLGHEIMPAPFPGPATTGLLVGEPVQVSGTNGSNDAAHEFELAEAAAFETMDAGDDVDLAARLEALTPVTVVVEAPVADDAVTSVEAEAAIEPESPVAAAVEIEVEPPAEDVTPVAAAALAVEAATPDAPMPSPTMQEKSAAQTSGLLRRFRPGQNLDAELDAYERERVAALAADEAAAPIDAETQRGEPEAITEAEVPVAAEREAIAEPEVPVAAEPEAIAEPEVPVAAEPEAIAEPEIPVAAEPEAIAEPEIPVAAEAEVVTEPTPAPEPAPTSDDLIRQPTWRMVAPDPTAEPPAGPPADRVVVIPPAASVVDPNAEPQWPTRPEWLGGSPSAGLPFLGRPATPQGGLEALWVESTRDVVAPLSPDRATGGVQPCIRCGLSLSATARFCRRCGTFQPR